MANFELASRLRLTFTAPNGTLDVSDLWSLPLQSTTGKANLDDLAKGLNAQLQATSHSFVETEKKPDERVELAFEIVKHIIDWRKTQNAEQANVRKKADEKQFLLEVLANKQRAGIQELSVEELEKRIAAL